MAGTLTKRIAFAIPAIVVTAGLLWFGGWPLTVAVAALGVLGAGLLHGVLIGAVISLVQLLRRASRPHVAFLGRIPGTRRYSDIDRNPDNEAIAGALIARPEASNAQLDGRVDRCRLDGGCHRAGASHSDHAGRECQGREPAA